MIEALNKNFVDHDSYPVTLDLEKRCVNMIANLFHAPTPTGGFGNLAGTSTVGSSEAIMLAVLALKKRWIRRQKSRGLDYSKPNIVLSPAAQVCWKKAACYFDIEEHYVPYHSNGCVMDPVQAVDCCDDNTIGICAILGTTSTGEYEDVAAVDRLLIERQLDVYIHVDAASGGFVAPFIHPELSWDFRLERVVSINVSGHKYGLVYAGIGWLIWRSPESLPEGMKKTLLRNWR